MLSEHNPIAELVHQIQEKWTKEVSPNPNFKLVRWLIDPRQARLYEGFLKLESTEHGALPEAVITMLTPFNNELTFAGDLMNDWRNAYMQDHSTREKLQTKMQNDQWDPTPSTGKIHKNDPKRISEFISMISAFKFAVASNQIPIVVALYPHSIQNFHEYNEWLAELVKCELPDQICFMVFDHIGEFFLDPVFRKPCAYTHTLQVDLDLDGAVQQIAKMGNPNSPEVKLRQYILEMGKAVQKKDEDCLAKWGEKALTVTRGHEPKSLYASAHIIYAGMLFNFKNYSKIDTLLEQGISIAKKGLLANDQACKPLLVQYHGFIAASSQMQKKYKVAIVAYKQQADIAIEFGLPSMALNSLHTAYALSKSHLPGEYPDLLQKAYSIGLSLQKEEQTSSVFPTVALDYLNWVAMVKTDQEANESEGFLKRLLGPNWKEHVKKPQSVYIPETQPAASLTQ